MAATGGRVTKKRDQDAVQEINNRAPIKKILDALVKSNHNALMFYIYNMRQTRTTQTVNALHYTVPSYPIYAFNEHWDGDINPDYFEPFSYKSFPPTMLTPLRNVYQKDALTEVLEIKKNRHWNLNYMKHGATKFHAMRHVEVLNEDVIRCPKHLVDMAAFLDSDPDPHLQTTTHNWHYSGNGNIQLMCIEWVDYLLHSEFTCLYVSEFTKHDLHINMEHVATFDCGEGRNILETICSTQNVVVLRTNQKIFILKIDNIDGKIVIEKLKETESEMPFTSVNFDSYHKNILYITTLDNNMFIVNLDRMTKKSVHLKCKNSLVNNWSTIIGYDRTHYTHVSRNALTVYDKRTNDVTLTWKNLRCITDNRTCNDITVAKQREGTPLLYIGTDHHLFLMDMRSKPSAVLRWTHGMQCVPTYMSICNFEYNKELVCLSSQWCEDMCVVPNYINDLKDRIPGVTMPYRPPSILNTLDEARSKALCYDLYNPIDSRICTAISGCLLLDQGEKYVVLMQNSLGDISAHTLYPEHLSMFMEDDSKERLHEWSKDFKIKRKDFEVSSIWNIAKVWRKLKKVPDDYILCGDKSVNVKTKFNEQEIRDAFESEELDDGLLEAWEIQQDETVVEQSSASLHLHFSDSE